MATRSILTAKFSDGSIKAIYVHYDGYGHLPILQENYNTQEKVEELISNGDIRTLEPVLESCRRQGGEPPAELSCFDEARALDWDQEFLYIWDGSAWTKEDLRQKYEESEEEENIAMCPHCGNSFPLC